MTRLFGALIGATIFFAVGMGLAHAAICYTCL
jgi:hypothetical protein